MKPPSFRLTRPSSLDEALRILAEEGDEARVIAGGQSLIPLLNLRLASPAILVDINRIAELAYIRLDGRCIRIGALTRQSAVLADPLIAAHLPLLSAALSHVGHVQTRSRGTIGGSIAHADPSAEIALIAITLDARLTLKRSDGQREVAARDFLLGALTTDCAANEILTEIAFPLPPAGSAFHFHELARRHGDFAMASVAIQQSDSGLLIGLGAVQETPRVCAGLQKIASTGGRQGIRDAVAAELADAAPLSDIHASSDYRRQLASVLLEDALAKVLRI